MIFPELELPPFSENPLSESASNHTLALFSLSLQIFQRGHYSTMSK
jgi:hypothetical protein